MGQLSKLTRLAKLMEDLEWNGHSNWTQVQDRILQKHVLEFKAWLRNNIQYIRNDAARDLCESYYFGGEEINRSGGAYTYLEYARNALYAAYHKEIDLLNESN